MTMSEAIADMTMSDPIADMLTRILMQILLNMIQ